MFQKMMVSPLMTTFGGFDFFVMAFLLLGLWRGFMAGFIKSVISFLSWFTALVAGSLFADSAAVQLAQVVVDDTLRLAAAFLLVVLLTLTLVHLAGRVLTELIHSLRLVLIDKMAGGALGIMRNLLVVLVVLSTTAPLMMRLPWWQHSTLTQSLMPYAPVAQTLVKKTFGKAWQQVNNDHSSR